MAGQGSNSEDSGGSSGSKSVGHTGTELTCRELVQLVTAYRDDALPPSERARIEAHLAICPPCVHFVEQFDLTVRAIGGLHEESGQEAFIQDLLTLFRAWKAEQHKPAGA